MEAVVSSEVEDTSARSSGGYYTAVVKVGSGEVAGLTNRVHGVDQHTVDAV